jgi:hypothetical protein
MTEGDWILWLGLCVMWFFIGYRVGRVGGLREAVKILEKRKN